ncbi:ATPase [Candidatus Micrarchaeota archaeon]|nr:ATPase [Candidatus Micrarchaeota archaeon]
MADAATAVSTIGDMGLIGLGAAIAMLGAAIGTAMVQSSVGSSIMGVAAERPEEANKLLIYYLIPESILILGFVISIMMVLKL